MKPTGGRLGLGILNETPPGMLEHGDWGRGVMRE